MNFTPVTRGYFLSHTHTPNGWVVALDDSKACTCNGNFEHHIQRFNNSQPQEREFVDVPSTLFLMEENKLQGGVDDILKWVEIYCTKKGISSKDIEGKAKTVFLMLLNVFESFSLNMRFLQRAEDWTDVWCVFLSVYKHLTGKTSVELVQELVTAKTWIMQLCKSIGLLGDNEEENEVQGLSDDIHALRSGIHQIRSFKKNEVIKNAGKILKYCLAFGLFTNFGLTFENLKYNEVEQAYIKAKYSSRMTFVEDTIEGTLYFLERAAQAIELKSWKPFLYNGTTMGAWTDKAFEIKNHHKMFEANNNPEITYSGLLSELTTAIEQGEQLAKIPTDDNTVKTLVKRLLMDLQFIYCEMTSIHKNQQMRVPPFAELICGNSSVGKTLFTDMLCAHFSRINHIPEGEEFTYHRNPGEAHWNGYKPHMHTIVYDDIGASNPKKVMGVDIGISELLPVINSNAMGANMADLKDKGHCPIKPAHVIVNTNIEDMHADVYYSFPLALRRRLPYIITVSPRVDEAHGIDYRQRASPSMLDTNSLPDLMPGEYPNQWNISVKHVIAQPGSGNSPPRVAFDDEHVFVDVYTFLLWYNDVVHQHKSMSTKMTRTQDAMHSDEWKKSWCMHQLPKKHCQICDYENDLQNPEDEIDVEFFDTVEPDTTMAEREMFYYMDEFFEEEEAMDLTGSDQNPLDFVDWHDFWPNSEDDSYLGMFEDLGHLASHTIEYWVKNIKKGVKKLKDIACHKMRVAVLHATKEFAVEYMTNAGNAFLDILIKGSVFRWLFLALPALASLTIITSWFHVPNAQKKRNNKKKNLQGSASSKYGEPMKVDEKDADQNPWYDPSFKVTAFDTPVLSSSWKKMDSDELMKHLAPNVISFSLEGKRGDEVIHKFSQLHALCLGGHLYVTNNHLIPHAEISSLHIVHGHDDQGVNINKDETLGPSSWKRYPERDLVFFELHIPPRQDIRSLLPRTDLSLRCEGMYLQRDIQGYVTKNMLRAVQSTSRIHPQISEEGIKLWISQAEHKTVNGDCGSVMIGLTSVGPMLMGLHVAGGITNEVESVKLDQQIVEEASVHFGTPIISSNTINLAPEHVLGPLHEKSIFRFMKGHAQVYGSFHARSSMRSKVTETLLAPALKAKGWKSKHGPPVMKGWRPWHHAIQPTLKHTGQIRNDILRQASDAYLNDILTKIPKEEICKLQILDDLEAINGVPGVKYLEGMNRNSSLGYPWCKSKRFMLVDLEDDDRWQDGVTFHEDVWKEVDRMVKDYEAKRVTHPVFVGQLKDEAVEEKKIVIGKTRVFLISSAAWTLIMRKWFLSFVRLFQRYRYVFEGMPGLRTQSGSWGKLRAFLTEFGVDRLFAGDFGKFDKAIEAVTMLEAFRVILRVCWEAGWNEASLDILWAIAEDTSFCTAIVSGDLVSLEGTNPSGQALTVLINCIVNSLYMRYVYILRNPSHEALTFQEFVRLATYGDDNAGNVSSKIQWFHHTAIQEELAKIGIEYTMADKSSESRPFIHIDEVEFLKRKFRFEEEVNDYFAPLNENSIQKRLMVGVQSSELTPEWQAVENLATSMEDYFFYGREVFEEKKKFLLEVGRESGLECHMAAKQWPVFDDLLERWREAPTDLSAGEEDTSSL